MYAQSQENLKWLNLCLKSCEQAGADEIVVWDDGSELAIRDITSKYNVTVYHHEHIGKSFARNSAVERCKSNLIYPTDADDELVPGAVKTLSDMWAGTPLYSDIYKLHGGTEEYYVLLPFDCDTARAKSISSVNVLHSKEQWMALGGWNTKLNMFEDWEYNSRLFWTYGGRKVDRALVRYRQHGEQSTKVAGNLQKGSAAQSVKVYVEEYIERLGDMGCCGKRRTGNATIHRGHTEVKSMEQPSTRTLDLSIESDMNTLGDPGPGNVWAKYFGGQGMGAHDKRGMTSRGKYMRVKYGDMRAVKAGDAVSEEEFKRGAPNCGFVAMKQMVFSKAPPTPIPTQAKVELAVVSAPVLRRMPVESVGKVSPEISHDASAYVDSLASMSVREIRDAITGMSPSDIDTLLNAERTSGKPRVSVVKMLEKAINAASSGG